MSLLNEHESSQTLSLIDDMTLQIGEIRSHVQGLEKDIALTAAGLEKTKSLLGKVTQGLETVRQQAEKEFLEINTVKEAEAAMRTAVVNSFTDLFQAMSKICDTAQRFGINAPASTNLSNRDPVADVLAELDSLQATASSPTPAIVQPIPLAAAVAVPASSPDLMETSDSETDLPDQDPETEEAAETQTLIPETVPSEPSIPEPEIAAMTDTEVPVPEPAPVAPPSVLPEMATMVEESDADDEYEDVEEGSEEEAALLNELSSTAMTEIPEASDLSAQSDTTEQPESAES